MKIKDLIFEAPVPPTTPPPPGTPAPKPPGIQKPVGNVPASGVRAAGAPVAGQTQQTPGIAAPGTTPQTNQPVPLNQQMGQNPPVAGQPAKPGQPIPPGQQPDPAQQFAQQLAQQTTQIGSTIKKELPAITKLAPGVNLGDPNKLAKDLALAQTQAPNKPLPPSLKPTFDKLGPVIGKMLAGDPSKLDAALKSAVPPK